jgi:hypothetical protein
VHPFLSIAHTRRGPDSAVKKATQLLWSRKTEVSQFQRSSTSEVFYGLCQLNRVSSTTCLNSSNRYLSMAIASLCFVIGLHVISHALKEVCSLNMFIMRRVCISASRTEQDMSQTHLVQQHSRRNTTMFQVLKAPKIPLRILSPYTTHVYPNFTVSILDHHKTQFKTSRCVGRPRVTSLNARIGASRR